MAKGRSATTLKVRVYLNGRVNYMICPDCKKDVRYQVKSDGVFRCCECTYKKNFHKIKNIRNFILFNKSYIKYKIDQWF